MVDVIAPSDVSAVDRTRKDVARHRTVDIEDDYGAIGRDTRPRRHRVGTIECDRCVHGNIESLLMTGAIVVVGARRWCVGDIEMEVVNGGEYVRAGWGIGRD